jgi:Tol biopolymer transport system component
MGEVYRARDPRIGRDVAIKILPPLWSHDRERLSRFEQEARAAGALNHPALLTVYDVGEQNATPYLVSELLEGETLRRRLLGGPLSPRRAIEYAIQIARGLAVAHGKGIVHRDIKPENIFVTKDGRVKILDFGLAKLRQPNERGSQVPTIAHRTEPGAVMGTAGYMSPEQVRGDEVDERSDIFSLGAVLYETLAGKAPFKRDSSAETMTAILKEEPSEITVTNPQVSPAVARVVSRCLEKHPQARYQSAADLAFHLEDLSDISAPPPALRSQLFGRQLTSGAALLLLAIGLIAAVAVGVMTWRSRSRQAVPQVRRYAIPIFPDANLMKNRWGRLALSSDGRLMAYASRDRGVYVYSRDTGETKRVEGTEGAENLFFSPDNEWIGFSTEDAIKKVPLAGGAAVTICSTKLVKGATWMSDGTIIFGRSWKPLYRVPASGGTPQALMHIDADTNIRFPRVLPDQKQVLYTVSAFGGNYDRAKIAVLSLDSGRSRVVLESGTDARYVPSGHLVFFRSGGLYAVPFDLASLKAIGSPTLIVNGVEAWDLGGIALYDVAADGTLVYATRDTTAAQSELLWVDRNGAVAPISSIRREYSAPELSPDGKRLLVNAGTVRQGDLWVYELERDSWTRLTTDGHSTDGVYSPDGKQIIFSSNRTGPFSLYSIPSDGSAPPKQLTNVKQRQLTATSWSADGSLVAIDEQNPDTNYDIALLQLTDPGHLDPWLATPFAEGAAVFSPDGRWIAFDSNETGQDEVYVRAYRGSTGKWLVSSGGGTRARWRGDGRELFYRNGNKVMAVDIGLLSEPRIGKPHELFSGDFLVDYDVTADGRRFVMIRRPQATPITHINVVTGLFENLKSRPARQ